MLCPHHPAASELDPCSVVPFELLVKCHVMRDTRNAILVRRLKLLNQGRILLLQINPSLPIPALLSGVILLMSYKTKTKSGTSPEIMGSPDKFTSEAAQGAIEASGTCGRD